VPGKISSIVNRVRKVFPRFLTMRVLMVGCAAGTGDLSRVREKDEAWWQKLAGDPWTYARQNKASLIVLKIFRDLSLGTRKFPLNGYRGFPAWPMTRLSLHYNNWDEYVLTLSKSEPKKMRRENSAKPSVQPTIADGSSSPRLRLLS